MVRRKVEKKLIAITGGIGSGKSAVSSIIKQMGYPVISADEMVEKLYKKRSFLVKIKRLFPTAVKGIVKLSVDKSEIAKIVFSDSQKLKMLNQLIHPSVMSEGLKRLKKENARLAFMEVPLLFEGAYQNLFDEVIVVLRDIEGRILSVISRSSLTREQVLERISNQIDYAEKDFSEYRVILNDGDKNALSQKVVALIKQI